jgi:hypothetical protein
VIHGNISIWHSSRSKYHISDCYANRYGQGISLFDIRRGISTRILSSFNLGISHSPFVDQIGTSRNVRMIPHRYNYSFVISVDIRWSMGTFSSDIRQGVSTIYLIVTPSIWPRNILIRHSSWDKYSDIIFVQFGNISFAIRQSDKYVEERLNDSSSIQLLFRHSQLIFVIGHDLWSSHVMYSINIDTATIPTSPTRDVGHRS